MKKMSIKVELEPLQYFALESLAHHVNAPVGEIVRFVVRDYIKECPEVLNFVKMDEYKKWAALGPQNRKRGRLRKSANGAERQQEYRARKHQKELEAQSEAICPGFCAATEAPPEYRPITALRAGVGSR